MDQQVSGGCPLSSRSYSGFRWPHLRTLDGWSKLGDVAGPFFENESIVKKLNTIRETLLAGKIRLIRITGLSGVGKIRLVFEAPKLSEGGDVAQDSLAASCVYLSYENISDDLVDFVRETLI